MVIVEDINVSPETLFQIHESALNSMRVERARVKRRASEILQYGDRLDKDIAQMEKRLSRFRSEFFGRLNDHA